VGFFGFFMGTSFKNQETFAGFGIGHHGHFKFLEENVNMKFIGFGSYSFDEFGHQ